MKKKILICLLSCILCFSSILTYYKPVKASVTSYPVFDSLFDSDIWNIGFMGYITAGLLAGYTSADLAVKIGKSYVHDYITSVYSYDDYISLSSESNVTMSTYEAFIQDIMINSIYDDDTYLVPTPVTKDIQISTLNSMPGDNLAEKRKVMEYNFTKLYVINGGKNGKTPKSSGKNNLLANIMMSSMFLKMFTSARTMNIAYENAKIEKIVKGTISDNIMTSSKLGLPQIEITVPVPVDFPDLSSAGVNPLSCYIAVQNYNYSKSDYRYYPVLYNDNGTYKLTVICPDSTANWQILAGYKYFDDNATNPADIFDNAKITNFQPIIEDSNTEFYSMNISTLILKYINYQFEVDISNSLKTYVVNNEVNFAKELLVLKDKQSVLDLTTIIKSGNIDLNDIRKLISESWKHEDGIQYEGLKLSNFDQLNQFNNVNLTNADGEQTPKTLVDGLKNMGTVKNPLPSWVGEPCKGELNYNVPVECPQGEIVEIPSLDPNVDTGELPGINNYPEIDNDAALSVDPSVNPNPSEEVNPEPDTDDNTNEEAAPDIDPDDYKLPDLKLKFPFCLPFDFVDLIKKLDNNTTAPKYTFKFDIDRFDIHFKYTIKFDMFDVPIKVMKSMELIGFIIFLIFSTKKLIWGA